MDLILGGTSLFGKYLAPRLISMGKEVITTKKPGQITDIDRSLEKFTGSQNGIRWTELDIMDRSSIEAVLNHFRPDIIYFFIGQNSVGHAWKNPGETVDINVIGALNLFDAIRSLPNYKPIVLMTGSGEEYGRNDFSMMPISEEIQPKPNNIFAATKVEQALLSGIYHRAYDLKVITVRTFNEIGPGMSDRFSVSNFCKQFAKCKEKVVKLHVGNTNIERDYTDIRDLTDAFIKLSRFGKAGEIYNAGRGQAIKISGVIDILQEISGKRVEYSVDLSRIRPIDTPKLESDNTKIRTDTGWEAKICLRQTVQDIYEYWTDKLQ